MKTVEQQIADLKAQVQELESLPPEPAIGAVVKFTKRMSGVTYSYAALHTEAGWYLTGRDGRTAKSWKQLLDYAGPESTLITADGWYAVQAPFFQFHSSSISTPEVAKLTINPPADWSYYPDSDRHPW